MLETRLLYVHVAWLSTLLPSLHHATSAGHSTKDVTMAHHARLVERITRKKIKQDVALHRAPRLALRCNTNGGVCIDPTLGLHGSVVCLRCCCGNDAWLLHCDTVDVTSPHQDCSGCHSNHLALWHFSLQHPQCELITLCVAILRHNSTIVGHVEVNVPAWCEWDAGRKTRRGRE